MAKIFLSHSTKNGALVDALMEFLVLALGIPRNDIFCTASIEKLRTGDNFMAEIRRELQDAVVVVSVITEEYLKSQMCLIEMGAGWSMSDKHFMPITVLPYEQLQMPLTGLQIRKLNQEGLSAICGELIEYGICDARIITAFTRCLPDYVAKFQKITAGKQILKKDAEGWYHTVITDIRPVRDTYRCYKISGHVEEPLDDGQAESEWIFFWKGMYEELQIGDRIKFQISKTEVKEFRDIGKARNIYPGSLVKLS